MIDGVAGMHGFVDGALERDFVAATIAGVLGDDGDAAAVVDAIGDGVGGESAEDDGVNGSDARAGEDGDGEFRRHAHVDGDAVALLDAEGLEGIGEALDFDVHFSVSEATNFPGLAFPDNGGLVAARAVEMSVEAVVAEVHFAADEPFGAGQVPVEHFVPRFEPVQFLCDTSPEGLGIFNGLLVHLLVLLEALDVRFLGKLGRRREDAGFAKERVEILAG